MRQQWYYRLDGETLGPVPRDTLQRLLDSGQLDRNAQVIGDGMRDWVAIGTMSPPGPTAVQQAAEKTVLAPPAHASHHKPAARRPTNQRPPQTDRLPFYVAGLVAVAAMAAGVVWIANSVSSSDNDVSSEEVVRENSGANTPVPRDGKTQRPHVASRSTSGGEVPFTQPASVEPQQSRDVSSPSELPRQDDGDSGNQLTTSPLDSLAAIPPDSTAEPEGGSRPPDEQPQSNPAEPAEDVGRQPVETSGSVSQQVPTVLFQELDIQRLPKFSVLGTVMAQDIHYRIVSELSVGQPDEKGFRAVSQVVKETQLVKADALSRSMFETSLTRLKGWQFSYTLNARGEVIEMRGPDDGKIVAAVEPAGGKGFLVTSVMDEDGWKELAELSFFQLDPQGMKYQAWSRQMTHDYEPLGSWFGETTFVPRGKQQDLMRIDFAHKLTYKPPVKDAAALGDLPLTIHNAEFKAAVASGIIYFDMQQNRVQSAQEQFHVRGVLSTEVLGQASRVEVEERQTITVRVTDQNP